MEIRAEAIQKANKLKALYYYGDSIFCILKVFKPEALNDIDRTYFYFTEFIKRGFVNDSCRIRPKNFAKVTDYFGKPCEMTETKERDPDAYFSIGQLEGTRCYVLKHEKWWNLRKGKMNIRRWLNFKLKEEPIEK